MLEEVKIHINIILNEFSSNREREIIRRKASKMELERKIYGQSRGRVIVEDNSRNGV